MEGSLVVVECVAECVSAAVDCPALHGAYAGVLDDTVAINIRPRETAAPAANGF